jgi:hypothetical protein
MNEFDISKLERITIIQSRFCSMMAEMEAMKAENQDRLQENYAPAWNYEAFSKLPQLYACDEKSVKEFLGW